METSSLPTTSPLRFPMILACVAFRVVRCVSASIDTPTMADCGALARARRALIVSTVLNPPETLRPASARFPHIGGKKKGGGTRHPPPPLNRGGSCYLPDLTDRSPDTSSPSARARAMIPSMVSGMADVLPTYNVHPIPSPSGNVFPYASWMDRSTLPTGSPSPTSAMNRFPLGVSTTFRTSDASRRESTAIPVCPLFTPFVRTNSRVTFVAITHLPFCARMGATQQQGSSRDDPDIIDAGTIPASLSATLTLTRMRRHTERTHSRDLPWTVETLAHAVPFSASNVDLPQIVTPHRVTANIRVSCHLLVTVLCTPRETYIRKERHI